MVAGLAFRNLYREGAPSLHAILLTADVFGVTYPPGTRLCSSPCVTRQPFLPVASVDFAAFAPCLTVDFKLYGCDNL